MSVSSFPVTAAQSVLQARPALRLAVGQLPGAEQNLVQIALRVLRPHLRVPCDVVTQEQADITIRPAGEDQLDLLTSHAERHVERPVRLAPLSDALSELITNLLDHEAGARPPAEEVRWPEPAIALASDPVVAPTTGTAPAPSTTASTASSSGLIDLLLTREMAGPLHVTLQSGLEFLVDARYHTAWLSLPLDDLPASLGNGRIASVHSLTAFEFAQKTGSGTSLQSMQVEQLCWLLPQSTSAKGMLDRWHANPDTLIELHTWPNLSRQSDRLPWLSVLASLYRQPLSMRAAVRLAEREDIPTDRARAVLGLLLLYKHAVQRQPDAPAPVQTAMTAPKEPSAAAQGLLGRLRSRLRSFMN